MLSQGVWWAAVPREVAAVAGPPVRCRPARAAGW